MHPVYCSRRREATACHGARVRFSNGNRRVKRYYKTRRTPRGNGFVRRFGADLAAFFRTSRPAEIRTRLYYNAVRVRRRNRSFLKRHRKKTKKNEKACRAYTVCYARRCYDNKTVGRDWFLSRATPKQDGTPAHVDSSHPFRENSEDAYGTRGEIYTNAKDRIREKRYCPRH